MEKVLCIFFLLACNKTSGQPHLNSKYPVREYISSDSFLYKLSTYQKQKIDKVNIYLLPKNDQLTDTAKNKLLSLLKRDWPDSLLKIKAENKFRAKFEYLFFYQMLDTINNKVKSTFAPEFLSLHIRREKDTGLTMSRRYLEIYDSIFNEVYGNISMKYWNQILQEIKTAPIDEELIYSSGILHLKEAIPILKKYLTSNTKNIKTEPVEIALAGLGDLLLQKKYFRKHNEYLNLKYADQQILWNDFLTLALNIHTQESISLLADWLDTSKTYLNNGCGGPYTQYYVGAYFIPKILGFIKNSDLKDGYIQQRMNPIYYSYYDDQNITYEQLQYVRNWLIKNKGKYEFD